VTWTVPVAIEEALWDAGRRRLPTELVGGPGLTAAVVDRSRRYTSEREQLAEPGGGRATLADLAARALFFTIADAAKVHLPLGELAGGTAPAPAGFLDGDELRVVDVGAGGGAMTIGLCTWLATRERRPRVRATLVDHDAVALAIAQDALTAVARALDIELAVETRDLDVATVTDTFGGSHDLVLAGSVLNELADSLALVHAMLASLAPTGVLVVIEPALRSTSRALHRVRDALLDRGAAAVLAPCTRRSAPCPALIDERDWCHEHRPLQLPPRTRQLAHVTGLRDGDMKLAYLSLCRAEAAPAPLDGWRVVSDPHASKGKLEMTLCGAPGWVPVRLLKRHRSLDNRALERAHRGDVLAIAPPPTVDAADIVADTQVSQGKQVPQTAGQ
jgi:SAM-dependent methyltransferase